MHGRAFDSHGGFMLISRKNFLTAALAMGASTLMPALVWAQTKLADVVYPNEVTVGEQKLVLNGYGIRFRFGFRVYAAGLYTQSKVTKNEEVLKITPKRMHLVALRDVKGDEFGKLFIRAMEDNASREEFSKSINGVIRMGQIFADAKQFAKGDVILVDYSPSTGTVMTHKGKQLGDPLKEPEFHALMMKIWFGPKPVDEALRKALLGEQTTANTNVT
jgi:Chalcone isomerase-like